MSFTIQHQDHRFESYNLLTDMDFDVTFYGYIQTPLKTKHHK